MFRKLSFILLLTTILAFQTRYFSQSPDYKANIYNDWMKLSFTGKSQVEIENHLLSSNVAVADIEKLKDNLRAELMNKFEQQKIKNRLVSSVDLDDLRVVTDFIHQEIRFAGMSLDIKLKKMIREKYDLQKFF